jgi:hypothetical protein
VSKKKKRLSGDGSLAQLTSIRGLHRIPHYESGSTNSLVRKTVLDVVTNLFTQFVFFFHECCVRRPKRNHYNRIQKGEPGGKMSQKKGECQEQKCLNFRPWHSLFFYSDVTKSFFEPKLLL